MTKQILLNDFLSGVILFVLTLPLSIGISLASGAPPYSGIISSLIGGVLSLFLSKSNILVIGPSATLSIIVFASISRFINFETFLISVIIAGIIQIILGVLKSAIINEYIPKPIVKGTITAISLLIIIKQLPHLLGYDVETKSINETSLLFAFLLLPVLIIYYFKPKIKLSTTIFILLSSAILLSIFISFIPSLTIPANLKFDIPKDSLFNTTIFDADFTTINFSVVLVNGMTLAIIASLDSMLMITTVDELHPKNSPSDMNRELVIQGIGNVFCGILGGLPISSVFVRSTVNKVNEVKSKYSILTNILLLLISVLFFSNILRQIPLSIPALVFVFIGIHLIESNSIKRLLMSENFKFAFVFLITLLFIIFTNLLSGVTAGIIASILLIFYDFIILHKSKIKIGAISFVSRQIKLLIVIGSGLITYVVSKSNFFEYERNLINNLQIFGTIIGVIIFIFWERRDKK